MTETEKSIHDSYKIFSMREPDGGVHVAPTFGSLLFFTTFAQTHHFLLLHLTERNERRRIIEGLVGKMMTVKNQLLRKNDIKNKDQE